LHSVSRGLLRELCAVVQLFDNVEGHIEALRVIKPRIAEALVVGGQVVKLAGATDAFRHICRSGVHVSSRKV
jgi:hypothetical protein